MGFLIIAITGIVIAFFMIKDQEELPVLSPDQLDTRLVDQSLRSKMSGHRIRDFQLINQFGKKVSQKEFKGKIYVADFFFTTCPGICPAMTRQMLRVQKANEGEGDFMIISHSVTPETDTPEILMEYAEFYGANNDVWQFVTGDLSEINDLARKSYFAATFEEGKEDEMVHTENFVLIDKEKRIRGIYDGTSEEEVDQLINDIETLRDSYD